MKRAALLLPLLLSACADLPVTVESSPPDLPSLSRAAHGYSFTRIEVPGALATHASGINARGDIVGMYRDASGVHGFLLRNGTYTPIDFPGAAYTDARGIGPGGEIVGTYRMPGEPGLNFHGFLLTRQGEFVRVDYPGHTSLMAQRILPDGTILGCRHDHDFMETMRGVTISERGHDETDAYASMHNGATPDGRRIVGLYTNMSEGRTEGYLIENGAFKPFLVPGSNMTQAWDINVHGDVVGFYRDATGFHGFLREGAGDTYTTVDVPGSTLTLAIGINVHGAIVGRYMVGPQMYGFVATPSRRSGP